MCFTHKWRVRSDDRNDLWSSKNLVAPASNSPLSIKSRIFVERKLKNKFCKYFLDTRVPVGYETWMHSMWGNLSLTTHGIKFIMERLWVCPFVLTLNSTNWICSGVCGRFYSMTSTGEKSSRARKRCQLFNVRWIKFHCPSNTSRIPRPLVHFHKYKDTELRTLLLFGIFAFHEGVPEPQCKREFPQLVVTLICGEPSMAWRRYVFVYFAEVLSNQLELLTSRFGLHWDLLLRVFVCRTVEWIYKWTIIFNRSFWFIEAEQIRGAWHKSREIYSIPGREISKWNKMKKKKKTIRWRFTKTKSEEKNSTSDIFSSSSSRWSLCFSSFFSLVDSTKIVDRSALTFLVVRWRFFCFLAYLFDRSVYISTLGRLTSTMTFLGNHLINTFSSLHQRERHFLIGSSNENTPNRERE